MRTTSPTRIRALEAVPIRTSFRRTFRYGTTERRDSANVILRLHSEGGVAGYGEATPQSAFTAETQDSIVSALERDVAPFLAGADATDRAALVTALSRRLPERPFTIAAVDVALCDLLGRASGLSVSALLGGRFRDSVPVHGSVGWAPDAGEMVGTALEQLELGFRTLKLYAGRGELSQDLARIRAVREAIPPAVGLILDINGQWRQRDCAAAFPELRELGVVLVEQPLAATDLEGQRAVVAEGVLPVAADESVYSAQDVYAVASDRRAAAVNLGLSKLGGLLRAQRAATTARASGLDVLVGSVLELGIATSAGLHLAATIDALPYPSYLVGPTKYVEDVTLPQLRVVKGEVSVPAGPGLGVEVDEERLASLAIRR